jgi:hypothetical protein
MREISFVRAQRISKSQLTLTVPQEVVKAFGLNGGEKFKVLIDEMGGIHYQKATA